MIMSLVGRRTDGGDNLRTVQFQFESQGRVGFKFRGINIFFDAGITSDPLLGLAVQILANESSSFSGPACLIYGMYASPS